MISLCICLCFGSNEYINISELHKHDNKLFRYMLCGDHATPHAYREYRKMTAY